MALAIATGSRSGAIRCVGARFRRRQSGRSDGRRGDPRRNIRQARRCGERQRRRPPDLGQACRDRIGADQPLVDLLGPIRRVPRARSAPAAILLQSTRPGEFNRRRDRADRQSSHHRRAPGPHNRLARPMCAGPRPRHGAKGSHMPLRMSRPRRRAWRTCRYGSDPLSGVPERARIARYRAFAPPARSVLQITPS